MVTTQLPVPVQPPPLQPVKVEAVMGAAASVTAVLSSYGAEHEAPQAIPTEVLVTVPVPVPACATVSVKLCSVNVAVTAVAAVMVTVHGPVPVHPPPLQPVNVEPVAGVAVSVTAVL